MADRPGVVRMQELLDDLARLVTGSGRETKGNLAVQLAAWRGEMDRARAEAGTDLTPAEGEDLARRARVVQARLEKGLHGRERDKRILLVRALSLRAVQNTLDCYRRPKTRSSFNRTV